MLPLLTSEQMRKVDSHAIQKHHIPELILMEHAGLALVQALEERFQKALDHTHGLAVAGHGNNGGDVLCAARMLIQRGICVSITVIGGMKKLSPSAKVQARILESLGLKLHTTLPSETPSMDWILDGLFGTGLTREVSGVFEKAIEKVNQTPAWVVSADIPSGLSADTGRPLGIAVSASHTVAFGFLKRGHVTGLAADYVGRLWLDEIQIPRKVPFRTDTFLFTDADATLPTRAETAHKGHFGHVYVWAGEQDKQGACILSSLSALRLGAGLCTLFGEDRQMDQIRSRLPPEIMTSTDVSIFEKAPNGTILLGPGMGVSDDKRDVLRKALQSQWPLVLDADALTLIAEHKLSTKRSAVTVLTPHSKEAARLLECEVEEIEADRYFAIKKLTQKTGCLVVLKGKGTLVSDSEETWVVNTGNTLLSKGGSGDILAGLIVSLLGQKIDPMKACALAVLIHGKTSERLAHKMGTERAALPSEIFKELPEVLKELER